MVLQLGRGSRRNHQAPAAFFILPVKGDDILWLTRAQKSVNLWKQEQTVTIEGGDRT
jgi:hypothetical protein